MKSEIAQFFEEEIELNDGGEIIKMSRLTRLTELFSRNGFTFEVTGWGTLTPHLQNQHSFNMDGLSREEAIELIKYESFILGIRYAISKTSGEEDNVWFKREIFDRFESEISRLKKVKDDKTSFDNVDFKESQEKRLLKRWISEFSQSAVGEQEGDKIILDASYVDDNIQLLLKKYDIATIEDMTIIINPHKLKEASKIL